MADSQTGEPKPLPLFPGSVIGLAGIAVGTDLVEVERIAQTVQRFGSRFLQRIFTPEELQESRSRVTWLAGRFAAKEACAKALGTGVGAQAAWRDMRIMRLPNGKPELLLLGDAAARAAALGLTSFDVSIAHTHQFAMAVVVGFSPVPGTATAGNSAPTQPPNNAE